MSMLRPDPAGGANSASTELTTSFGEMKGRKKGGEWEKKGNERARGKEREGKRKWKEKGGEERIKGREGRDEAGIGRNFVQLWLTLLIG